MNRLALLEKCHACMTLSTPATLPTEIAACATNSGWMNVGRLDQILNIAFRWTITPQGYEYFDRQYIRIDRTRVNT